MDILKQNDTQRLIEDLKERTGLPVTEVHIQRIDLLRDTADIVVNYQIRREDQ